MLVAAHAKLFGARLHTSPHHETVTRLKDVQRTWDARVRHRAHKDRDVLSQTRDKRGQLIILLLHNFSQNQTVSGLLKLDISTISFYPISL